MQRCGAEMRGVSEQALSYRSKCGRLLARRGWLAAVSLAAAGVAQAADLVWSVRIHQPGVSVQVGNARPVIVSPPVVVTAPTVVTLPSASWGAPPMLWVGPPPVLVAEAPRPRRPHPRHGHAHGAGCVPQGWAVPGCAYGWR